MSGENGYIRIYRKMTEWEWYKDYKTLVVFLHLLLLANWKQGRFMGHEVPAGSLVTSLKHLSQQTGLSVQSVRTALEHLKSTNEINIQVTNKFQLIKLNNWGKYQGDESTANTQLTNNQHSTNNQLTTIEKGKKERKKENYKRKRNFQEREVKDEDFADMFLDLNEEVPV